jgi:hypothetical protein
MKRPILVILLICVYHFCSAQLIISPLRENRVIKEYIKNIKPDLHSRNVADTLTLPFFDDFSRTDVFPNSSLWLDKLVFINNSYSNYIGRTEGNNAPSINVATFDGFDDKGNTYSLNPNVYGRCDTLTSKPVDLSPVNPNDPAADSVYLSFYIQPQGTGYRLEPEVNDSLLLEFKIPGTNVWHSVQSYRGYTQTEIDQWKIFPFALKMIAITDTNYLKKGFQFRFVNKGSLYGADDIWNIDYVKLDRGRSGSDSLLTDISFNADPSSFLKTYTAIPFQHYSSSLIADNTLVAVRNNFNINKTFTLTSTAYNMTDHVLIDSFVRGISNMLPYSTSYEPSAKFSFVDLDKESVIRNRYYIVAPNDSYAYNDTIELYTDLKNYFAYDDGTAEGGLSLETTGDGRFAVEFELKEPDTITSVRMYFNRFLEDVSQNLFTLTIWRSITLNSDAQDIAYQKTTLKPQYDGLINGFAEFNLDSAVVLPAGKFYVGWVQNTNIRLNVGYDRNTDSRTKVFYNVTAAGWQQSPLYGTAMIRPVLKSKAGNTGTSLTRDSNHLKVYPNPANNRININYKENTAGYTVDVFDLLGKNKSHHPDSPETIDITTLENGVYFLQLTDHYTNRIYTSKIIKADSQ